MKIIPTATASNSGYQLAMRSCIEGEPVELITSNGLRIDRQRQPINLLASMRVTHEAIICRCNACQQMSTFRAIGMQRRVVTQLDKS